MIFLDKFGGHDFACGLSLKVDKLEELRSRFEKVFKPSTDLEVKDFDFELNLREVTPDTLTEINLVGPLELEILSLYLVLANRTSRAYLRWEKIRIMLSLLQKK